MQALKAATDGQLARHRISLGFYVCVCFIHDRITLRAEHGASGTDTLYFYTYARNKLLYSTHHRHTRGCTLIMNNQLVELVSWNKVIDQC